MQENKTHYSHIDGIKNTYTSCKKMTTKTVSWLHITDLHVGQPSSSWLWPNVKAIFLDDLRIYAAKSGGIDVVIFSGDLTQRGEKKEYQNLNSILLEIWDTLISAGSNPVLFCVPGNHDLQRPAADDPCVRLLKRWQDEPDVINELWQNPGNPYKKIIENSFLNYAEWLHDLSTSGIMLPDITHGFIPGDISASISIGEIRLGLAGLNTAYFQLGPENYFGKLNLDIRQLNAITTNDPVAWHAKHDISLLVTHHPAAWLAPSALQQYRTEIYPSSQFHAHLYGHMHDIDSTTTFRGEQSVHKVLQGTSLFGLEKHSNGNVVRRHGYMIGRISLDDTGGSWKIWPRLAHITASSGRRKIICDPDVECVPGEEYSEEPLLLKKKAGRTALIPIINKSPSLILETEKSAYENKHFLERSRFRIQAQIQHLSVRAFEQNSCVEDINTSRLTWISADWGVGLDGFLGSVRTRLGTADLPLYKITLGNYQTRDNFQDSFAVSMGCAFSEFCKALAAAGRVMLLMEEAPTELSGSESNLIEMDVEQLAQTVLDFCPEVAIVVQSRSIPKQISKKAVQLRPLDEADTRTYLLNHPASTADLRSPAAVHEIFRHTDGIPGKIDAALSKLRVVDLAELGLTPLTSRDMTDVALATTPVPFALKQAVQDLEFSEDIYARRAFSLLKVLSILPAGELLSRISRFDSSSPFYPDQAVLLLDRNLIEVLSAISLIGPQAEQQSRSKVLVVTRPVRDYVLSKMNASEILLMTKTAASLYFGEDWRSGNARTKKTSAPLTSEDGRLLQNPHSLMLNLMGNDITRISDPQPSSLLALCKNYSASLYKSRHYRHCATVCRDIISRIPEDSAFEADRQNFEFLLAKSVRMAGDSHIAEPILARLTSSAFMSAQKVEIRLQRALCLQSMDKPEAVAAAQEVIDIEPKSNFGLQAKSIILEIENDLDKEVKLRRIEVAARKQGGDIIANNIALNRANRTSEGSDLIASLQLVYSSAIAGKDSYNASRAAVALNKITAGESNAPDANDLNRLMVAYQYLYGERFDNLSFKAHRALWTHFESAGEVGNLFTLFRHSSFLWRLNGKEERETIYIKKLLPHFQEHQRNKLNAGDQDAAYFAARARTLLLITNNPNPNKSN